MPPLTNGNPEAWVTDELGDLIATTLGLTMDSTMFVGELPEAGINNTPIADGLYLIELPGPEPDKEIDTETHMFELWSTSQSTKSAYSLLHRAYDTVERKANYALVNWYVYLSYANSTIRDEGRGAEGNKLFSLGLTLICRNLNNIS